MSSFDVKVRRIDKIEAHPNADKLECVVIGGYRAVVAKDIHQLGDLILYVPEDTVFTNLDVARALGIADYLTGKQKNRVKAIRLRGLLSQGIVLPLIPMFKALATVPETRMLFGAPVSMHEVHEANFWIAEQNAGQYYVLKNRYAETGPITTLENQDFANLLLVEKYEEPVPIEMAGQVRRWPSFVPKYDVENIKRPESMESTIPGELVVATEKLHGTNMTVAIGPELEDGEQAFVCSRNNALKESETNVYWRAARKFQLIEKIRQQYEFINAISDDDSRIQSISLHGEVVGVQDLKYGHINGDIGFYAFDVMVNGQWWSRDMVIEFCKNMDIPIVPEVYRGPYDYETLNKLAQGKTTLGTGDILEGLVVKPVVEREGKYGERVQFKFISEDYLLRGGKLTEFH